jgi:restriction system protein
MAALTESEIITLLFYGAMGYLLLKSFGVKFLWRKVNKVNIDEIDDMSGIEFEKYLEMLFKKLGYSVKRTQASGDYGADLIISTKGYKVAVQAKRYKNRVGLKAVQEIVSAKAFYRCSDAWVVTNSYFTNQAHNLAKMNNVSLIDREELIRMIIKANKKKRQWY